MTLKSPYTNKRICVKHYNDFPVWVGKKKGMEAKRGRKKEGRNTRE